MSLLLSPSRHLFICPNRALLRADLMKDTLHETKANMEFNIYTLRSKLRLFNTLVKPVLLYGSETWKINEGDNRKLDTFFSSA